MGKNGQNKLLAVSISKIERSVIEIWENEFGKPIDESYIFNQPTRASTFKIHIKYILISLKALISSKKYDYIVFWQQFMGIYYALFSRIFIFRKSWSKTVVLTFIYLKRPGIFGKLYFYLIKFAINSPAVDKFVCHSTSELEYLKKIFNHKNPNKIIFCPLGEGVNSRLIDEPGDYYFSGGSSNRDYSSVINAFKINNKKLVIACKPENIREIDLPSNIKIYYDAYGNKFFDLIRNSKGVIVLVENDKVSAGQLVILNAMRFGKPLFVTRGNSMRDYTDDSYCFEIDHKSISSLNEAIRKFEENENSYKQMSRRAFDVYNKFYSLNSYAKRIADIFFEEETIFKDK